MGSFICFPPLPLFFHSSLFFTIMVKFQTILIYLSYVFAFWFGVLLHQNTLICQRSEVFEHLEIVKRNCVVGVESCNEKNSKASDETVELNKLIIQQQAKKGSKKGGDNKKGVGFELENIYTPQEQQEIKNTRDELTKELNELNEKMIDYMNQKDNCGIDKYLWRRRSYSEKRNDYNEVYGRSTRLRGDEIEKYGRIEIREDLTTAAFCDKCRMYQNIITPARPFWENRHLYPPENYCNIIVSGPQRSGTTFTEFALMNDLPKLTGKKWEDKKEVGTAAGINSNYAKAKKTGTCLVQQAPKVTSQLQDIEYSNDTIVYFMGRDCVKNYASGEKIHWNCGYGKKEIEKYHGESENHFFKNEMHCSARQRVFVETQMDKMKAKFAIIDYESYSDHPLWVGEDTRKKFKPKQTTIKH